MNAPRAALGLAVVLVACSETPAPNVPPLTVALPSPSSTVVPSQVAGAGANESDDAGARGEASESPVTAAFVDVPGNVDVSTSSCSRVIVALAKGKATLFGEALAVGDTMIIAFPSSAIKLEGSGLALVVTQPVQSTVCLSKPLMSKQIARANAAPKLAWARGAMSAHLDVGAKLSPDLYFGRLEGTASVPEHTHAGTWEIVAAVEADGTFTLDGREGHLGPRQIVAVPPRARHAWKPQPGSKLVALQMYSPPGPEQRFIALAAAENAAAKDAGTDASP